MPFISVTFNGQSRWFRKSASGVPANSFLKIQVARAMGVSTSLVATSPEQAGPFPEFTTTFTGLAQSLMTGPLTDAFQATDEQFGTIDAPNFDTGGGSGDPEVATAVPSTANYTDVFRFRWSGSLIRLRLATNMPATRRFEITRDGVLSGFVASSQLNIMFPGWRTTRAVSASEARELNPGFDVSDAVDAVAGAINPFAWFGWNPIGETVGATGEIIGEAADVVTGIGTTIGGIPGQISDAARTAVSFAPSMLMMLMIVMSRKDR